jgi:hypothetical protein
MKLLLLILLIPLLIAADRPPLVSIATYGVFKLYKPSGPRVYSVKCHREMEVPLSNAVLCIQQIRPRPLLTYHGCYNRRNVRGEDYLSKHSYGKAIDLNVFLPMPSRVVDCFEDNGFKWGGRWSRPKVDIMHFEIP